MKKLFKTFTLSLFTLMALYAVTGILQDKKYNSSAFMELDKIDHSDFEMVTERIVAASKVDTPQESLVKWIKPIRELQTDENKKKVSGDWKVIAITLSNGKYEDLKGREDDVTLEFLEDGVLELKYAGEARGKKVFLAKALNEGNTLDIMDPFRSFHDNKSLAMLFVNGVAENTVDILHLEKVVRKEEAYIPRKLAINKPEPKRVDYDSIPASGFAKMKNGVYELKAMYVSSKGSNNIDQTKKFEVTGKFELEAGTIQGFNIQANDLMRQDVIDQMYMEGDVKMPNGGYHKLKHEDMDDTNVFFTRLGNDLHIKYPNLEGAGFVELVFSPVVEQQEVEVVEDDNYEGESIEVAEKDIEVAEEDNHEEESVEVEKVEEEEVVENLSDEEQNELMNARDVASFDFTKP